MQTKSALACAIVIVASTIQAQGIPCGTQEAYNERLIARFGRIPAYSQCQNGLCDQPGMRNASIPDTGSPMTNVRLFFHILCNSDSTDPKIANPLQLQQDIDVLNLIYQPYKFRFVWRFRFDYNTRFRYPNGLSETDTMKNALSVSPSANLNIYLQGFHLAYSYYPWDDRGPLSRYNGICLSVLYPTVEGIALPHEVGHCLGLWHPFHAMDSVSGEFVPMCSECYARADGTNADVTGDNCSDTPPQWFGGLNSCAPEWWFPERTDWCNNPPINYSHDPPPSNIMNQNDPPCNRALTPQQAGRMHCWFSSVLSSWKGTQFFFRVPEDFPTIQAAIDVCQSGDTITVAPGTYSGTGNTNLDFQGKALILRSSAGASATTIDCGDNSRAILLQSSEPAGSRIIGFTIKDGYSSGNGGGAYLSGVSAAFDSCVFLSCRAQQGGAVFADGSASTVTFSGCVFDTNTTTVAGGAIYANGSLTLNHCTFAKNNCTGTRPAVVTLASTNSQLSVVGTLFGRNQTYAIDCQSTGGTRTFTCNDFWQNGSGTFHPSSNCQSGMLDATNVSSDPRYCDFKQHKYTLCAGSPCSYSQLPSGCSGLMGAYDTACIIRLASPPDGTREISGSPNLVWSACATLDSVWVQMGNANFSSIVRQAKLSGSAYIWNVSPNLNDGLYYWRVLAKDAQTHTWSDTSEAWTYEKYTNYSSCPILYTYDGAEYVKENPLLTACENYGYQRDVTDYYHVTKPVAAENGHVRFQLRELEDEISYINSLALMTVDHDPTTNVACGTNGSITLYREKISPLSVTDQNGIDRLNQVRAKDGLTFTADAAGYLEVTFPNTSRDIIVNPGPKLPCQDGVDTTGEGEKVAVGGAGLPQLQIEVRDSLGRWVSLGDIPTREAINQEFIGGAYPVRAGAPTVTFRISWTKHYDADVIQQIIPIAERPLVQTLQTIEMAVSSVADPSRVAAQFSQTGPLLLQKGDILDFSFEAGEPAIGQVRDYIIVANGRYEPIGLASTSLPDDYQLYDNYPNPFNPSTTISYDLPKNESVILTIVNSLGQVVTELVNEVQPAGHHSVNWNATDKSGHPVASGVYFYKLRAGEHSAVKKMMYLK